MKYLTLRNNFFLEPVGRVAGAVARPADTMPPVLPRNFLRGRRELSETFDVYWLGITWGRVMQKRQKLTLVCDADGSIGVVMEFADDDCEAYAMPDLALGHLPKQVNLFVCWRHVVK